MLNRRRFMYVIAGGAASCLLPAGKPVSFTLQQNNGSAGEVPLAVVRGPDPAAALVKAVELAGGMGAFVSKGDVVFVKPNISWDRVPVQAATTNPAVVEAVVRMVLEAGAKKVIVADNACNDARRTYVRSGIKEAAEKAGAVVPFMEKRKFVKTNIGGEVLKEWEVYRDALECDKLINVPVAKHHSLSGVTLSMKNLMGLIGGRRDLLHQKLSESVTDLTAFFKPALNILDAVRLLKANGPQGGTAKDVEKLDTIAASTDPVKIDAFGVSLFGGAFASTDPRSFPHIVMAEQRGLGTSDFRGAGYRELVLG